MKIARKNPLAKYFVIALLALGSTAAFSQVSISIGIAPPPLPEYEQPACPDDGYMWIPGYWAYGDYGYYWVPGTWVQPPEFGVYWTPAYWGWGGSTYIFHSGYWGSNVGFYGGINYGHGYGGNGYGGGRWEGRRFSYNSAVNNVGSININNTYVNRTGINNNRRNVSYNGGNGGVQVQPNAQERKFSQGLHIQPTLAQKAHVREASIDRGQLATVNGGRPVTPAAARPDSYTGVAKKHAAAEPLTPQDRTNAQQDVSAKKGAPASVNQQVTPERQAHSVNPKTSQDALPSKTNNPALKPQNRAPQPQTRTQPQNRAPQPQTRTQPQNRAPQPQTRTQPQTRAPQPQTRTQPQTRAPQPQTRTQPQNRAPQPQTRTQPQNRAPQPQARPQQSQKQGGNNPSQKDKR